MCIEYLKAKSAAKPENPGQNSQAQAHDVCGSPKRGIKPPGVQYFDSRIGAPLRDPTGKPLSIRARVIQQRYGRYYF
jgi:hypothetical protein